MHSYLNNSIQRGIKIILLLSHRSSLFDHSHLSETLSKLSPQSLSLNVTLSSSLFHHCWPDSSSTLQPPKLDVTDPPAVPSRQSNPLLFCQLDPSTSDPLLFRRSNSLLFCQSDSRRHYPPHKEKEKNTSIKRERA